MNCSLKAPILLILLTILVAASGCTGVQQKDSAIASNDEIRTAHVGDIDMAYKILGNSDSEPLLMIMGFKAGMDMWDPRFLSNLSSSNRVIIFDNRGIGYTSTPDPEENLTIAQLSNDTVSLMDALKIQKANILGYSMGADIAQEIAIRYPERVDRLILYGGDCNGPSKDILEAFMSNSGPGTSKERVMKKIGLLVPPAWLSKDQALIDWFFTPKENVSRSVVEHQIQAMNSWQGTGSRLDGISAQTLVIAGTKDAIVPIERSFKLAQGIDGSWLIQFRDGGHGLMYQYPDRLAGVVNDFIQLS